MSHSFSLYLVVSPEGGRAAGLDRYGPWGGTVEAAARLHSIPAHKNDASHAVFTSTN